MWADLDFTHWDFFFFFATATTICIFALHRLRHVKEAGEVDESVVIKHLRAGARRTLRNLPTVAGLRASTGHPLSS